MVEKLHMEDMTAQPGTGWRRLKSAIWQCLPETYSEVHCVTL